MLSFIHLSDIHFSKYNTNRYAPDNSLRNELLRDIRDRYVPMMREAGRETTCVLVCGDIAYSAKEEEYGEAEKFLRELCAALEIPPFKVFCVPGNHDMDWSRTEQDSPSKNLQDSLASISVQSEFESKLGKMMSGELEKECLFFPLSAYNKFAGQYLSGLSPEKDNALYWESKNYSLNPLDSSVCLRLRGLNSCIISNADDHRTEVERLMRICDAQIPNREPGVVYMTLCHHPPECWEKWERSEENMANKPNRRAAIQLYGHRHVHTIRTEGETSLVIGSGAAQPPRGESEWFPRYNWIQLDWNPQENAQYLTVLVFPRIYLLAAAEFAAENEDKDYCEYQVKIDSAKKSPSQKFSSNEEAVMLSQTALEDIRKETAWNFMQLNYVTQSGILLELNLLRNEDAGKPYVSFLMEILNRASEQGVLESLRAKVMAQRKGDNRQ